ncbi:hypothetical protein MUK42_16549 [Musa troglodytarum]|uniref:Uncharacterized protein n=1 Tax=Musa troglodytarum TaxID=320322 RepID=A0A9E7KY80_9LILI|nr:hypothetical protein MUK42_16549 [Musa troglodytarum]
MPVQQPKPLPNDDPVPHAYPYQSLLEPYSISVDVNGNDIDHCLAPTLVSPINSASSPTIVRKTIDGLCSDQLLGSDSSYSPVYEEHRIQKATVRSHGTSADMRVQSLNQVFSIKASYWTKKIKEFGGGGAKEMKEAIGVTPIDCSKGGVAV